MFTLFFVFVFVVLMVPLGIAALGFLFKEADGVCDRQWELYQQRYDECCFPQAAGRDAPGRGPEREAAACPVAHGTRPHRPEAELGSALKCHRGRRSRNVPWLRLGFHSCGHEGAR